MEMEPGKLFIGGISWDTNEDRLKEYFQTFGEVVEAVIMKDRTTGRARGFGFVVFADPAVAERVVKEKHMIDGRTVEAKKAVPRDDQQTPNRICGSVQGSPGPTRTKKIFVGGLASTVTESDFKNYFDQFGTITDVVVMYDHNTQRPRGFGFITFDSEEAVDRVLLRTFHELNGKMVEVKRAVPKELSPGSIRSQLGQLGGQNYGLSRVGNLLNAYTQGYSPSPVGGYGLRMDGRFSPAAIGRSGYSSLSPGYGLGSTFEPGLGLNFEGSGHFGSNISYTRNMNAFQTGSPNRYGSPVGHGIGGTGSVFNSMNRNTWGDGGLNYTRNLTNSAEFMGSASANTGLINALGNIEAIWGSSPISGQDRGITSFNNDNINYGNAENSFDLGGVGYARNTRGNMALSSTSSFATANSGYEGSYANFNGSGSVFGDTTWRSSSPDLDGPRTFDYDLRNALSEATPRDAVGYVGGYSVTNRANRGIAT
ncbi:heterogeneous nuclear ribonucleoprotein 1-like isoform X2 [Apium graveolens]